MNLMTEELEEFYDALLVSADKASPYGAVADIAFAFKMINKGLAALQDSDFDVDIVEAADAMTDMNYINEGSGVAFGIDLDKCFAEVQRSNMSKLDENGKPLYRDDGKILKSSLYSPPDLRSVLAAQGWETI